LGGDIVKRYLNEIMLFIVGIILMGSSGALGIFLSGERFNEVIEEILYRFKTNVFILGFLLIIITAIVVIIKITELFLNSKNILLDGFEKIQVFLAVVFLITIPVLGIIFMIIIISFKWLKSGEQQENEEK